LRNNSKQIESNPQNAEEENGFNKKEIVEFLGQMDITNE
jgi:hypothetical protein